MEYSRVAASATSRRRLGADTGATLKRLLPTSLTVLSSLISQRGSCAATARPP